MEDTRAYMYKPCLTEADMIGKIPFFPQKR